MHMENPWNTCIVHFVVVLIDKDKNSLYELPRGFIEVYGGLLKRKVNLLLADGSKFCARFCRLNNLLYDLGDLYSSYSFRSGFFVFFDYVGPSSIFLTIYTETCVDIFNGISNQLFRRDICKKA